MKMNKTFRKWRHFLAENEQQENKDRLETARVRIGKAFNYAVLQPVIKSPDGEKYATEEEPVIKVKDIVKKVGRDNMNYLYYKYKGVDDNGNLLDDQNINEVIRTTAEKVLQFLKHFQNFPEATNIFVSDYQYMSGYYDQYREDRIEKMAGYGVRQPKDNTIVRTDAGRYSTGRNFSVVGIGQGSMAKFYSNQDYMYKDSEERPKTKDKDGNLRPPAINKDHEFAFDWLYPMQISVIILAKDKAPRSVAELLKDFKNLGIPLAPEKEENLLAEAAINASIDTKEQNNIPELSYEEFVINYIEGNITSFVDKETPKVLKKNLDPEMALTGRKDFFGWIRDSKLLMSITSDPSKPLQITDEMLEEMWKKIADNITNEILDDLEKLSTEYKKSEFPDEVVNEDRKRARQIQQKNRIKREELPIKLKKLQQLIAAMQQDNQPKKYYNKVDTAKNWVARLQQDIDQGTVTPIGVTGQGGPKEQDIKRYILTVRRAQKLLGFEREDLYPMPTNIYPVQTEPTQEPPEPNEPTPAAAGCDEDCVEKLVIFYDAYKKVSENEVFSRVLAPEVKIRLDAVRQTLETRGIQQDLERYNEPRPVVESMKPLREVFRRFL